MLSLLNEIDKYKVVLASESPRRFELLKMIGMDFIVRPSHIEGKFVNNMKNPLDYAFTNATNKGHHIAQKYPGNIVISADTIVVLDEKIIEKPRDEGHAFEILRKLNGRTHEVITAFGIILLKEKKELFSYEKTRVTFRRLNHDEMEAYILTGEPFDKAGGYGAQGYGSLLIKRINGCFYNVVGFPLAKFFKKLDIFLNEE